MNAESSNCKGGRIRGCLSIGDLFQYIDMLWMTILHDAESANCKGDRIRGYVSICVLFLCIDLLHWLYIMMQNWPTVKEIGLEDVYQEETYIYILTWFEWLHYIGCRISQMKRRSDKRKCIDMRRISMFWLSLNDFIAWCRIGQL